jgi:hypothetical protein
VGASGLSVEATRAALEMAGLDPAELDCIVFATLSPDFVFPGSGVLLQAQLGPDCPETVAKLFEKVLARERPRRPSTAREFANLLRSTAEAVAA